MNKEEQTIEFSTEKTLNIADVMAMLPSSETVEANGMEGGLRDGELQMFWEGAEWLKSHLQKRLLSKGNAVSPLISISVCSRCGAKTVSHPSNLCYGCWMLCDS